MIETWEMELCGIGPEKNMGGGTSQRRIGIGGTMCIEMNQMLSACLMIDPCFDLMGKRCDVETAFDADMKRSFDKTLQADIQNVFFVCDVRCRPQFVDIAFEIGYQPLYDGLLTHWFSSIVVFCAGNDGHPGTPAEIYFLEISGGFDLFRRR